MFVVAVVFGAITSLFVALQAMLGDKSANAPNLYKRSRFECGMETASLTRVPFSVSFLLRGITFILFDVELTVVMVLPYTPHFTTTYLVLQ